jgi:Rrf2 family protein
MRLNRATVYALEALANLCGAAEGSTLASHDMARANGVPEKFMLKVLLPLVQARLLHSLRGPHGGYRLARPAKDITVLEVVEAVDGPIRGQAPGVTDKGLERRLQALCDQVAEATRAKLAKVKLSDLAGQRRKG